MRRVSYFLIGCTVIFILTMIAYWPYHDHSLNVIYQEDQIQQNMAGVINESEYCRSITNDPQIVLQNLPASVFSITIKNDYPIGKENDVEQGQLFYADDISGFSEEKSIFFELRNGEITVDLSEIQFSVLRIDPVNESNVVFKIEQIILNDPIMLANKIMGVKDILICIAILVIALIIENKVGFKTLLVALMVIFVYFYSGFVYQYKLDLQFLTLLVGLLASYAVLIGFVWFWRNEM